MIVVNPVSPVAFSIAGFAVRWYALAYVAAFVVGAWVFKRLIKDARSETRDAKDVSLSRVSHLSFLDKKGFDDLFTAVVLGVILGGRLGYVLFYNLPFFIAHPLEIFAVWHGGMSFHGGLAGVLIAVFLFSLKIKKQRLKQCVVKDNSALHTPNSSLQNTFGILDVMAIVAPIGLFFGRIANFINMEVMGRPTTQPLGVVFAGAPDMTPRHASPLYEAALEGLLLFVIMFCLWKWTRLRDRAGAMSGIFAMLYAVFRIFAEQFRAPDAHIGFLTNWGLTMGQLLSAAMFIAGAVIFVCAFRKNKK